MESEASAQQYDTSDPKRVSFAGTRTRVSRMRISYPNHLDYEGT